MPEIEKLILKIDVQMSEIKGKISQVIGPVVDVSFEKGTELPKIYDAFYVNKADGTKVVLEVQSPVAKTSIPLVNPSVESIDMARTEFSPTCDCTSRTTFVPSALLT